MLRYDGVLIAPPLCSYPLFSGLKLSEVELNKIRLSVFKVLQSDLTQSDQIVLLQSESCAWFSVKEEIFLLKKDAY